MVRKTHNLLSIALIGIAALILAGCYTLEGAGRDVSSIGETVEDTADAWRPYE